MAQNPINTNTSTAKGLELIIMKVNAFIKDAQAASNGILYGKFLLQSNSNATGLQKALDRGLLKVLEQIASVDFCNLINYVASNTRLSKKSFDPRKFPETGTQFEKTLWQVQNKAFFLQSNIDQYYAEWGSGTGQDSRLGLVELSKQINLLSSELSIELRNPEIVKEFPEVNLVLNFLNNVNAKFSEYATTGIIPVDQIQSIVNFVDKLRFVLISVQSLSTPANVLAGANIISGNAIQEQLAILNQYTTPQKAPKFLKDLLKQAQKIVSIGRKIIGYINLIRTFIKICLLLIKVFYIVTNFLKILPIPNILTTAGVTTTIADINESVIKEKGITRFIRRLQQINIVLSNLIFFATSLVAAMDSIILSLRAIILNIESCNPDLANDISDLLADLEDTRTGLQTFINEANAAKNRVDNTFGGYTIEIVTEQVTDEGISLKRRFGIARDKNNIIAVQSTPTFASLDLIIINEVKVLLVSKGLVQSSLPSISAEDAVTVMDAMNYLGQENDIDFDANTIASVTSEENDAIGLGSFVSNLPGGRALRKKVRDRLIKSNEALVKNLKSTDPNSTYSQSIIKEKESETNKLKIQKLEDQKKDLQKSLLLTVANPIAAAAIAAKIKDVDNQIKALKNNQK